jgi:hypothetical protein
MNTDTPIQTNTMEKKFLTPETITKPDFEDCATNYFQDEPGCRAGIQLQKDAWNAAIDAVMLFINDRNMVQVDELKAFKV